MGAYRLTAPTGDDQWRSYHRIRRRVLFEARGRFGVYDEANADEHSDGHVPLLLWHDGQPVGTVRIDLRDGMAILRLVAIDEAEQRRGHGRALVAASETFARTRGCRCMCVNAAPDAVEFYRRCGFVEGIWSVDERTKSTQMLKALSHEA